jgi:hypothetical protein
MNKRQLTKKYWKIFITDVGIIMVRKLIKKWMKLNFKYLYL